MIFPAGGGKDTGSDYNSARLDIQRRLRGAARALSTKAWLMTSSHDIPTVHARASSGQAVAMISAIASLLGVMLWGLTIVRSIDNTAASTQSMLYQFIRQHERSYDQINERVDRIDSRVRTLEVKVERNI